MKNVDVGKKSKVRTRTYVIKESVQDKQDESPF